MRTPMQIFKKHNIHYYENDENSIEIAMQEYADEFACAFAEWNKEKAPMGLYNDGTCIKPKILTELLEIFKKEQYGL